MSHSYCNERKRMIGIPDKILSRMINRAMLDGMACNKNIGESQILRLNSIEPRCFAPRVDVTRAEQAYGKLALPKLGRELRSRDINVVRQAVTTIADIAVNPEEIVRIIQLEIHEILADLLVSEDPYVRERVAIIYETMSRQSLGREAIFYYPKILENLTKGLRDTFDAVRIKMARVIEILARHSIDCDNLCVSGFLATLIDLIETEKKNVILAVHLESLESLLNRNVDKTRVMEIKMIEKLVSLLLNNEDEEIVVGALSCLAILSQEPTAKKKFIEMDLLSTLKNLLNSSKHSVYKKAAAVIVFVTTTTPGKLRAFELEIIERLVRLAGISNDPELQIISIQALTNIAEVPEGKKILLVEHSMFIEDIDSRKDEAIERYKNILLKIIRSCP